ncbi:MAG: S1 family peptidase [Thermoguttaceae bacterium]
MECWVFALGGVLAAGAWAPGLAGAAGPCADGSCQAGGPARAAVVRVVHAGGCGTSYGSGTLVASRDRRGLVLTCAHLFRGGAGAITVAFQDGRRHGARLVAADEAWDLAALEIADPAVQPAAIATDPPRPGELLQSCGFGPDGRLGCIQTRVLGYARTELNRTHETLTLSGEARPGDSGGPVFNARGELVAVVWGTDGRTIEGTYCGRIRRFLGGVLGWRRPLPGLAPEGGPADSASPERPAGGSPPSADQAPGWTARLEELRLRLEAQVETLGQRIGKIESVAGLVERLKDRIEKAESAVGVENLRALVREAAGGLVAGAAPSLLARALPAVLAALGWTGPPSLALIVGLRVAGAILRRRAARRRGSVGEEPRKAASTLLNDEYARQLAGVYALSGRSPTADATLGREYDEELRRAEQSSDAALARWAKTLRERVARRFYRIHSESPLPAEPAGGDPPST